MGRVGIHFSYFFWDWWGAVGARGGWTGDRVEGGGKTIISSLVVGWGEGGGGEWEQGWLEIVDLDKLLNNYNCKEQLDSGCVCVYDVVVKCCLCLPPTLNNSVTDLVSAICNRSYVCHAYVTCVDT